VSQAGQRADVVVFRGDGEPRSPRARIEALAAFEAERGVEPDDYSRGGTVAELERAMASLLDREAAVFLPTGTLANHLALRRLCTGRPRVLVQAEGHIYNDTGDGASALSGLNLVPLAPGRPAFTLDEVAAAIERSETGRVANPVGAIVIESPVRRQHGRVMPYAEMRAVVEYCRARGVGTHLDGARLFMMSAATGLPVRAYAALFDTVYVSLWKYLGAPFGAILAGPSALCADLYHERRMFGGSLPGAWMAAALALAGAAGFEERFAAAMARGRALCAALSALPGVDATPFEDGSNIVPLRLPPAVERAPFAAALLERGIVVSADGTPPEFVPLTINPTILRRPLDELVAAFAAALAAAGAPPDRRTAHASTTIASRSPGSER
jgi:threonine aldolase